jgi:hypothetical protein
LCHGDSCGYGGIFGRDSNEVILAQGFESRMSREAVREELDDCYGAWFGGCGIVHGHFQVNGNAELAIGEFVDPDNLSYILAIHGVVRGAKGKRDENAHTLVIVFAASVEIDAFL